MRFNLIVRQQGGLEATFHVSPELLQAFGIVTCSDAHTLAPALAATWTRAYGMLASVTEYEVQCVALVPHPEFYHGPVDPEWDRMVQRLAFKSRVDAFCQWLDGYAYAIGIVQASEHAEHVCRYDYANARDILRSKGFAYDTACRMALLATRRLFDGMLGGRALGLLEPL